MSIGFVYLRPLALVGTRELGPYSVSSARAWTEVLAWMQKHDLYRSIGRGFGMMLDNPQVTPNEKCRYEACIELLPEFEQFIPAHFIKVRLPGGSYARQRHIGLVGLGSAISGLRDNWVASQGLAIDARRPFIEIHLDNPEVTPEAQRRVDLCVPVIPASIIGRSAA